MAKGITFAELASQLEIKPQSLTQNLKKGYFSETGLTRIANFINADYVFEAPKKLSSQEKVVDFMSKERTLSTGKLESLSSLIRLLRDSETDILQSQRIRK